MHHYRRGLHDDRRRKLFGVSRYRETPARVVIELSADGRTYAALSATAKLNSGEYWQVLRPVFEAAQGKLTRRELLSFWPAERRPRANRLFAWLQEMVAASRLRQEGRGVRQSPFRYWLPEREAAWQGGAAC